MLPGVQSLTGFTYLFIQSFTHNVLRWLVIRNLRQPPGEKVDALIARVQIEVHLIP